MAVETTSRCGHPVTAEAGKRGIGLALLNLRDKGRSVLVAGCLACYDEVLFDS